MFVFLHFSLIRCLCHYLQLLSCFISLFFFNRASLFVAGLLVLVKTLSTGVVASFPSGNFDLQGFIPKRQYLPLAIIPNISYGRHCRLH